MTTVMDETHESEDYWKALNERKKLPGSQGGLDFGMFDWQDLIHKD